MDKLVAERLFWLLSSGKGEALLVSRWRSGAEWTNDVWLWRGCLFRVFFADVELS
jgi:hypothetical protein